MLGNVREKLTKRYQLAKAAKVEANRRLKIIALIKRLRLFINGNLSYDPMIGMPDVRRTFLERVSYAEPELVNDDMFCTLNELYYVQDDARKTAAAYKIQTWFRMASTRAFYKKTIRSIYSIQGSWRHYKLRKFFMQVKQELKKRAVLLLQRQLRGYLAYSRYFAKLKGTMTKKNLDYIIDKYADAKAFMLECL